MGKATPSLYRGMRRFGIALLIVGVLIGIGLGWLFDRLHDATRLLIQAVGLANAEEWLRKQSVWSPLPLFFLLGMVAGYAVFKSFEFLLIWQKQFLLAFLLSRLFDLVYVGILNYFLHIYGDQLLAVKWIKKCYDRYESARSFVLAFVREQGWYRHALVIKEYVRRMFKNRSMLKVAKRVLKRECKLGRNRRRLCLAVVALLGLGVAGCDYAYNAENVGGRGCDAVDYRHGVYYFHCTQASFGNALSRFKEEHPYLQVTAFGPDASGANTQGVITGYFVNTEPR